MEEDDELKPIEFLELIAVVLVAFGIENAIVYYTKFGPFELIVGGLIVLLLLEAKKRWRKIK